LSYLCRAEVFLTSFFIDTKFEVGVIEMCVVLTVAIKVDVSTSVVFMFIKDFLMLLVQLSLFKLSSSWSLFGQTCCNNHFEETMNFVASYVL